MDVLEVIKAMDTQTQYEGLEFVPKDLSAQLIEKIRLNGKVFTLFENIPMPTNPFDMPVEGGDATAYTVAESTDDSGTTGSYSTPGTAKITLTAKKIMAKSKFSRELSEDSIIAILPYEKAKIARAISDGAEELVINGDDSTFHMDVDVTASADVRKLGKGLRKLGLANAETKVDLGTFNLANLRSMETKMKKYANIADLEWVTGMAGYNQMKNLAEVSTVQNIGNRATLISGKLMEFDGIPITISEHVREDVNATGFYDGTTKTKTTILLVNKRCFLTGTKAGISLATEDKIEYDQTLLVSRFRFAWSPIWTPSATYPTVIIGYNVATS